MANVKELKKRIKSTKGTLKITAAMKLVSAAKLSKAQQAIQSSRPFANELEDSIKTISALVQNYSHSYLEEKESAHEVLLVISSDKGLCGGYNGNLAKPVREFCKSKGENLKVFFIGKKVRDLIQKEVNVGKTFTFTRTEPSFDEISKVAKELAGMFTSNEVSKIHVAYNVFESAISTIPTIKQVLPMSMDDKVKEELQDKFPFDFKYDPSPEVILDELIPEAYASAIWTAQLDAIAAEYGSRMTAMDNAVRNCKDAIRTLTLKMNKLRQAAITTELIEVVSGAESLNG